MPQFCVCFQILHPQCLTLSTNPFLLYPTAPRLFLLYLRWWKRFSQPSTLTLHLDQMASAHMSEKPALLLLHILSLPFLPCHLHSVIFHLLGNPPSSLHDIKNVQKRIPLTSDLSAYEIISNVMESIIAVDMKSFLFSNNLISDHQVGFRPGHSTLDMLLLLTQQWMEAINVRHEIRALWTFLVLFIQSSILPCSPNSLLMTSQG